MEKGNLNFCFIVLFLIGQLSGVKAELVSKKKLLFLFEKIEINGSVDVFLIKGKRFREATIYADSKIIDSVLTNVHKKTLFIDANNTYNIARRLPFLRVQAERKYPVEIIISTEGINEISLLGNSNLTAENVNADKLSVYMKSTGKLHFQKVSVAKLNIIHEGSGSVVLKGNQVENFEVKITKDGSLFADELEVKQATLIHQGSGIVHLNPKIWLDARIYGTGNLFLHCKPESLVIDKQGSGTISDILTDAPPLFDLNNSLSE